MNARTPAPVNGGQDVQVRPLRIRYLGWSSIEVTTPDGVHVHFDPNYTAFDGECLSRPDDYRDADVLLVSHGHFDHCQDAPSIARATGADVVTSTPLARFVMKGGGVDAARVHALDGHASCKVAGLVVESQPWLHRTLLDRWPRMLAARPRGLVKMRAALRGFLTSPLLAFRVTIPGAWPVSYIGEAFHGQTDAERVRAESQRADPGIALVALEPHLEEDVAGLTALLGPRAVLTYSAHDVMWRYFGLPEVDVARFQASLRGAAPAIAAYHLSAGDAIDLPEGGAP
jgi:hypothetical protein